MERFEPTKRERPPIRQAPLGELRLSLSEIKSERTDDAVRRELASAECIQSLGRPPRSAMLHRVWDSEFAYA
jgi:hypothetical protein